MESPAPPPTHRIALITGGLQMGGSTTFLINLAGELIRRGLAVSVLSFERENPLAADFQRQRIPVLCLDERRFIFEDRLKTILRELAGFQPTVVAATLGGISFEVLRYLPDGIFRIGLGQSDDPQVYEMMRHYAPWLDLAGMVSEAMKARAATVPGLAAVPTVCLPYGVPVRRQPNRPARPPTEPLRILYLGRLAQEQKRVRLFPRILSQLCASGMAFHWTIAGTGPERGFLEDQLKTSAPHQQVSFAGLVPYAAVPELLAQNDLFLLASDYEGLPLSLLEAMGEGLVPVVTALPSGIPEVVEAANGYLVPLSDEAGYARALIHADRHRAELAAKSQAARTKVSEIFSIPAMADRWLGVLPTRVCGPDKWPGSWRIGAPVTAPNPLHYCGLMRGLRRWAARRR